MIFTIKAIGRFCRLFRRNEDGGPTVEFALVFFPFMVLSVSGFEMGLMTIRHVMLERGVSLASRAIQLNTGELGPDQEQVKTMICQGAGIIQNCLTQVRVEMRQVDLFTAGSINSSSLPPRAPCLDLDAEGPVLLPTFQSDTVGSEVMVVRACGLFTPMLP